MMDIRKYGNYSQQLHNVRLLEVLDELIRVCEKYGLKYYLAYGSAIGAVRHKGIIPWDDDIDVAMPREDYNKLLALADSAFGKDFRLCSYQRTKDYTYDVMKLESLNTTLIERVNPIYVGGVYVDIFPFENVPTKEVHSQLLRQRHYFMRGYVRYLLNPCPQTYILKYWWYKIQRWLYLQRKELRQWDELGKEFLGKETVYVADLHCDFPERTLYKREVFADGIMVEFEGRMCRIPKDYDTYLSQHYGEYMKLPPVEKRVLKHEYLFEDDSRRLSLDELKPIIAELKKQYYYQYSLSKDFGRILRWMINKI